MNFVTRFKYSLFRNFNVFLIESKNLCFVYNIRSFCSWLQSNLIFEKLIFICKFFPPLLICGLVLWSYYVIIFITFRGRFLNILIHIVGKLVNLDLPILFFIFFYHWSFLFFWLTFWNSFCTKPLSIPKKVIYLNFILSFVVLFKCFGNTTVYLFRR